jgi:pimeloyl-ACP methyl ester carboxylesterase
MMHRRLVAVALALIAFLGLASHALAAEVVQGRIGPGAVYRLVRPDVWNGSLLIYAHGFVATSEPVELPEEAELFVDLVTSQGFAIAYSSYSENGWAVKDGAQRTFQLLGLFESKFGSPSRVYLGGASMGGLIAIKLVEDHPGTFAGTLPACAAAGGTRAQFDYLANVRALFDVAYPGVLPGNAGAVPTGLNLATAIAAPAAAAIIGDPRPVPGAALIASVDQTPVPFSTGPQLLESMITALTGHAGSFSELVTHLPSSRYFDNSDVTYTSAVLPPSTMAGLNAAVGRFDASPSALNYMRHFYQPTGEVSAPMLMLSTSLDPVLPGFHQRAYRDLATAAGQSDLLVQRTINRYGHCTFTPAEIAAAFGSLVAWVELGIKPTP